MNNFLKIFSILLVTAVCLTPKTVVASPTTVETIECLPNNPVDDVVYLNITKVRAWGWQCSVEGTNKIQRIVVLKSQYSSAACIRKMESFIKLRKDYNKAEEFANFKSLLTTCSKPFSSEEDKKLKEQADKEIMTMVKDYEMLKVSKQAAPK
ncbi:MAG: hypothetical protein ACRDBG_00180 [Waterburya sp.]